MKKTCYVCKEILFRHSSFQLCDACFDTITKDEELLKTYAFLFVNFEIEEACVSSRGSFGSKEIASDHKGKRYEVDGFKVIDFRFETIDFSFKMNVYSNDDRWFLVLIVHNDAGKTCPFCHGSSGNFYCPYLCEFKEELFKKIMKSKAFRFQRLSEFPNL